MDEFYGECYPFDTYDHRQFGYPDCGDAEAMADYNADIDDYDASHGIIACYNATDYEGAVDLRNNEGFTEDPTTNNYEM